MFAILFALRSFVLLIALVPLSLAHPVPADGSAGPPAREQEQGEDQAQDPALDLYYSANALYNRNLYSLAIDEYDTFLERHPRHDKAPHARLGLALCHYNLGHKKKCEPLFAELVGDRNIGNQQEIHNLWGQSLLALERLPEAESAFAWSANHTGDDEQTLQGLAGQIETQYRQSKWKDVARNSTRFREQYDTSSLLDRVTFQGAVARFELAEYESARRLLDAVDLDGETEAFKQHVAFLLAESHRLLEDPQGAMKHFNRAARNLQGAFTAEALYRLGYIRFQQGDHRGAIRDLQELLDAHGASPHTSSARLYLGRSYLERNQLNEAQAVLKTVPSSSGEYGTARLWLARAMIAQKKETQAQRTLAQALKIVPANSPIYDDLLFESASIQIKRDDFTRAATGFQALVDSFPRSPLYGEALRLLAYTLHKAGRHQESFARCTLFLQKYPKSERRAEIDFMAAENLFLQDKRAEATPRYRQFVATYPAHTQTPSARFRLGQIHYRKKEWRAALKELGALDDKSLQSSPFFAQLDFLRGECLFNVREWAAAAQALTRFCEAHKTAPNADLAALKVALAHVQLGASDSAVAALNTFLKRYPKSPYLSHGLLELGRLHYEAGRYGEAKGPLLQASRKTEHPHALYYLGYVAMAEGQPDEAAKHFRSLSTAHPGHELVTDALLQLGLMQIRMERYRDAEKTLARLLENDPPADRADSAWFYLGLARARQSKWKDAVGPLETVLKRFADSSLQDRALYELAWCDKGQKQPERAVRRYAEFIERFPKSPLLPEVLFELAELEYEVQAYNQATARLLALTRLEISEDLRERTYYRLGWNYYSSDRLADAAQWFEALITAFPRSRHLALALYQAGEGRLALKEFEPAYRHFRRLIDFADGAGENSDESGADARGGRDLRKNSSDSGGAYSEQALLRLGECAALTQRWKESENVCLRFARQFPKSDFKNRALFGRGWALENQQRYTEAIEAYGKVLERGRRDETSARSQFQIGECLFAQQKYDEAIKALIKVEVMYAFPEWSAKALLETGRALEIPGKSSEARACYSEVVEKYPDTDAALVARRKLEALGGE